MKFKRGFYDVFVKTCAINPSKKAVCHYNNGEYRTYSYSELFGVCEYISQNLLQLECNKDAVGLVTDRNVIVPCAIAAVHKCCNTFMFLDPTQKESYESDINNIKFKIIISINENGTSTFLKFCDKKPDKTFSIFNYTINFYKQDNYYNMLSKRCGEHSFIATTSGSTGKKKHIQVPVQCIQPNIDDLTILFNVTSSDIIYFSTPLTFDPSMVEILLAFKNGASLLIAPEKSDVLFPKNINYSITVWQTTPSKFFQHTDNEIKNDILSANSTLKILALGGEPLNGIRRLRQLKNMNNKTRIFTLYGVTEMSCWACVAELDLKKIIKDREIPLGNCLSETQVHVDKKKSTDNSGKIVLVSSTRKCFVLNKQGTNGEEHSLKFVDTGDIGEVQNGTIYYRGRKDDTVKRFGNKVNLQYIENSIMECSEVKTCSCVWLPKLMLLVLYYSSETICTKDLSLLIRGKLDEKYWPDKIVKVDNLPTNPHGKTSKHILSKMVENDLITPTIPPTLAFLEELTSMIRTKLNIDQIKNKTFLFIGGTSFLAIAMCNKLSHIYPQLGNLILPHLISNNKTIHEITQIVEKEYNYEASKLKKRSQKPETKPKKIARSLSEVLDLDKTYIEFQEFWKYDTGKCVDASPTLYADDTTMFVTGGSHSGKIVTIDTLSNNLRGSIKLNSRIEASTHCFDSCIKGICGVVGSYDGTVVCFALKNCEEIWKINVRYMIKSKAAFYKGVIYIAAYDGVVRCIDAMNGEIKQSIHVAGQAISADLVIAKNGYIMVGTLAGVCAGLDTRTKKVAWRGKLSGPVFARPALYDADKFVVFAEVNGEIHCRTVEKGIKVWVYLGAKGNIFSSLYIRNIEALRWQFVFGCHDNGVYSITVKNFRPTLQWRTDMSSPVYSTPCRLDNNLLIATSTNGKLSVINSDNGAIISEYQLPNESFSSPAVFGDKIYIGCRDDYLYCIKYLIIT